MELYEYINRSAFFIGAVLIVLSCLIYTLIQRKTDRPQTRLYLIALILTILNCVTDMLILYCNPLRKASEAAWHTLQISHYLYFMLHGALILVVYMYAMFATKNYRRLKTSSLILSLLPWAVMELLMLTNPLTHAGWYFDADRDFHRNWAEYVMYGVVGLYAVVIFIMLIFFWYAITRKRRIMIIVSSAVTSAGVLLQLFYPDLMIELFAEAVTFIGFLLAIEYDDDRMDFLTDFADRASFVQDVEFYYHINKRFHILVLQLTNLESYQRMTGAMELRKVHLSVANALMKLYPRYKIYRVGYEGFALLIFNNNEQYVDELAEQISRMIKDGTAFPEPDTRVEAVVLKACAPDDLHSVEDVMLLCDSRIQIAENGKILKTADLTDVFEKAEIERALFRGFDQNCFEVFYQLVYTSDKREIHSAEALLRLRDESMGLLLPKDFIPLAERNGIIDKIGILVLRKVCDFIKTGHADKIGIQYININLSMLQCLRPNYAEQLKAIVKEYGVDPGRIHFEIRETFELENYAPFVSFMKECHEAGFRFALEGYGSGYSNLNAILSLEFDEIKLDKTMLWESDQGRHGQIVLENSVNLIRELQRPIVAVGIEQEAQLVRLKELGVDYIQGYYLSEPQTIDELLAG